ncbi:hypothetical protein J4Q44_G00358890 [Coregonus suidteri]|uniref:Uncharacterized protein n=1 Tax=Coregonus suidteri TaxID=861788 RepID=A0AAN8KMB5_9TELE
MFRCVCSYRLRSANGAAAGPLIGQQGVLLLKEGQCADVYKVDFTNRVSEALKEKRVNQAYLAWTGWMPLVLWGMMAYQYQGVGIKVKILSNWPSSRGSRDLLNKVSHKAAEWKLEGIWR